MSAFDPRKIEGKWIQRWNKEKIFKAEPGPGKEKFYLTVAYPYPSGSMHVGHGRTYTVPDVIARYKRMQGYNVLFPMAWHVTGSPVLGIAERIKAKDEKTIRLYNKLYKVPEKKLNSFTEPLNIVEHFSQEYKDNMNRLGFSIDWSREFLTITPQYSKFITWQYLSLKDKGLIVKGEHPVRYCPRCDNPVGDHDLLEGESATINEFVVLKFRIDDMVLPAATLRPETVFGVTNMWLNPDVMYVKAEIDGEKWLLSREAAEKLKQCDRKVKILEDVSGERFIGKSCVDPIGKEEIPILPAEFVDPDYATGVVMSVPAHAPYDYVALRDLDSDIKPKVIIELGDMKTPAKEIVEEMNIKKQSDKKLEQATEILYRREHSKGLMIKSIKKYGGLKVDDARAKLTEDLINSGRGDLFFEFSESPVVCRCGSPCVIRILKDQWFLEYGDKKWKEETGKCFNNMEIIPKETRQNFEYFIDWLRNWACTRRVGLGTKLPWDENWIIEPLSDSTIYMAYYTISHHLKKLDEEKLNPEFFDYVFLGKGDKKKIAEDAGIPLEEIDLIRNEFNYWYPPEWRLSAKDLVGNHLTFHVFHHTALFPVDKWPKGIVVFGMGLLEGEKMSSSKGNIILLEDALDEYGSDVVRLFLLSNAEPWQDFDWRKELVRNTGKKLKQFHDQVVYSTKLVNSLPERDIDRWLMAKMDEAIVNTRESLEAFQIRKALQHAFFEMIRNVVWYSRRGEPRAETLKKVADKWVRLMAPFTPFICENLWELTGSKGFVSEAEYPSADREKIDVSIIEQENIIRLLMEDIQSILEVMKQSPEKIHVYLAPEWKRELYREFKKGKDIGEIMKNPLFREHGKEVASIIKDYRVEEMNEIIFTLEQESAILSSAVDFLKKEFNSEVQVHMDASYDPKNKARFARPMKPGLFIE